MTLFRLLQTSPFSFVARKGNRRRLLAGRRDYIPSRILYTLTNGIFACEWDFYAFSWLSLFVNCCVTYFVTHPGICQGVIGYSISSFMGVRDIGSCQPLLCHSFWLLAGRRCGFFIPPNPLPLSSMCNKWQACKTSLWSTKTGVLIREKNVIIQRNEPKYLTKLDGGCQVQGYSAKFYTGWIGPEVQL